MVCQRREAILLFANDRCINLPKFDALEIHNKLDLKKENISFFNAS